MAIRDDDHWLSIIDGFTAAAAGSGGDAAPWLDALDALAAATGSAHAELVGVGAGASSFNMLRGLDEEAARDFQDMCGYCPSINPRVALGLRADVLATVSEADCEAVRPQLRSDAFFDWAERHDVPFGCQTNLVKQPGMLIGLAVLRSRRDGPTTDEDRRAFAALSPHVRTAVKMQLMLDGQASRMIAGALEAVSIAAFVCDGEGRVQACSAPAEALAASGGLLALRQGRLAAAGAANALALDQALGRAGLEPEPGAAPAASTVVLRPDAADAAPLILDVFGLPQRVGVFASGRRVLVAVRGGRAFDNGARVLELAYGLTPAEAAIAIEMARGRPREAVARLRGVSVGTVRIQLKSIFHKLRLGREAELAALLAPLV